MKHAGYNFLGLKSTTITGRKPLAAGKHTIRFEFTCDGGGPGKGGQGTLFVDNEKVGEGRIEHTHPYLRRKRGGFHQYH